MIQAIETGFEGLKLIETNHFEDERGVFHKFFSADEYKQLGLSVSFKENYYSVNRKNVIRGMHFQIPPKDHDKLVFVTSGKIQDISLDIRKNSATYGKYFEITLSADKPTALYIPRGFAHGFLSCEDNTCVHYLQTSCYSKEHDCGILYNSFGYDWGVENSIVSKRDLEHPMFEVFKGQFLCKKEQL